MKSNNSILIVTIILMGITLVVQPTPLGAAPALPDDIQWLTNTADPVFASPEARRGGTFHTALMTFPLTFRTVGPDSNSSFRSAILGNQLSLIGLHPNTLNIIPELATHWAFDLDKKTMYFKLNPRAQWSDGVPVTADDFAFTLEFMRSEHIIAPWYNDYYTQEIDRVIVYDGHTLAVVSTKAVPDLHLKLGIAPTPRHYYQTLGPDFVRRYNWEIVPNTGAYQISYFRKGKYVMFKRKPDWWGNDLHYFNNRFNVDRVKFTVVRDFNVLWEYFKKARIDTFAMNFPQYWHIRSKTPQIEKGYIERIWFFNDTQQSAMGLWLNQDREIFRDPRLRYAFAHAMNVEKVIEQVLRNDYFRLESGFVGYGPYSNTEIRARRFDLEKVNEYMKEAGWRRGPDGIWTKGGRRFSVEVSYSIEEHTPRLVVLKEEAKKAGIELQLQRLDPSAAYKMVMEKKHDVAWMGWSTSLRPQYWEHFHSVNAHKPQTNNITNTDDPELDRLIDAYRNSLDEAERIDLSRRIQARVHEIGCFVPTFMVPYVRQAYWRWWRLPTPPGTRISGDLFDPFDSVTGGLFWFDEARHEETRQAMRKRQPFPPVTRIDETYKMKFLK
ncbi:extracellular solute-binding protein [Desulfococcus multivorans]|nr:extracellular solute-binding protein [Desulfococcus multivorans]AOY59726.1 extracellular solute-binding protein, family 5 [Desulfococcus multivorans]